MDLMTFFAGQGDLAAVRAGNEAVIIDAHMPDCDELTSAEIAASLSKFLAGKVVRGLILTGFDRDHACPSGVEDILERYEPGWVMYPSYFKDTDTADEVFTIIERERQRRANSPRPAGARFDLPLEAGHSLLQWARVELLLRNLLAVRGVR